MTTWAGMADRRIDRRTLLVAGASSVAGVGAYVAARELGGSDGAAAGTQSEDALFLLDREYVNLTTFLLASHPRPVREAIERHRRELDANAALYLREAEIALEDEARAPRPTTSARSPTTSR